MKKISVIKKVIYKRVIKEVTDNGIVLENKNGVQVVNLDYVVKLREYPYNKKGKRSTITDM